MFWKLSTHAQNLYSIITLKEVDILTLATGEQENLYDYPEYFNFYGGDITEEGGEVQGGNSIDLKIWCPNLGQFPGCWLAHNIALPVVCITSDLFTLTLWTKLEIFVCPKLWQIKSSLNCHQEFQLDWTRGPPASNLLRLGQHAAEPLRRHTQILWHPQMSN